MATLAEINKTLLEQNKSLQSTSDGVKTLSNSLVPFVKGQKGSMLDDLEERREKKSGVSFLSAAGGAIRTTGQRAGKAVRDFKLPQLPPLSTLLNPIALGALATTFLSKFLGKLTKGGLLAFFAEEIAEFIVGDFASDALKKQLTQGLTFAGAGLIFGPRVALLAGLVGFFLQDPGKVFDKLKEIVTSQSFENIRKYIQDVIVSGLDGLLLLMQPGGIFKVFENGLVKETLVALGLLATAVATIFPVGGMFKIAGLGLWFGGKIKDALVGLGKLALAINASGATGFGSGVNSVPVDRPTRPRQKPRINIGNLLKLGAGGALIAGTALTTMLSAAGFVLAGGTVLFAGGKIAQSLSEKIQESKFAQFLKGDPSKKTSDPDKEALAMKVAGLQGLIGGNPFLQANENRFRLLENKVQSGTASEFETEDYMRRLNQRQRLSAARENINLTEFVRARNEGTLIDAGLARAAFGMTNLSDNSVNQRIDNNMNMISTLQSADALNFATNQ